MTVCLEQIYTMTEAACRLRMSRRSLQDLIKAKPFYFRNGARKLFTESDLAALVSALREPCRSSSSRRVKARRRAGTSGEPTSDAMWTKAQALLNDGSQDRFSTGSRAKSNVVNLPVQTRPRS